MLEQPQQRRRVAAQRRGIRHLAGGARLAGRRVRATDRGQQPEVGIGEMARVLAADQQSVHGTTLCRGPAGGAGPIVDLLPRP